MSVALVERTCVTSLSQVSDYFVSLPEELMPTVKLICQMALDLLQSVKEEVGCVKLKLLLPVPTYKAGFILWRQSYVLIEDLQKFDLNLDRFARTVIDQGAAISVEELHQHDFEVQNSQNFTARWCPDSKTIKLSAEVLKQGLQFTLFELTNASFNSKIQALFSLPKEKRAEELERIEFESTKAVRERLDHLGFQGDTFQLTHRHFRLHYLYQELKGHEAHKYAKGVVSSTWPHPMTQNEREKLCLLLDSHIYAVYGNPDQKKLGNTYLSRLSKNLDGNLQLNWTWYQGLYQELSQGE